jgi:hypothetical protein
MQVRHGWVADERIWVVAGPLFERRLRPLLAELPWLRGTAFTLDFAFLKRYRRAPLCRARHSAS